ncbi:zinc finger protein 862-like [Saccostrea cucullata]|uniref:zinc finger protein 862-like n=1 Tax=Saccostrea cuccullata TaxID=36930 RepID=UPI002ED09333
MAATWPMFCKRKSEEKEEPKSKRKTEERVREFKKKWQEGRDWLDYSEDAGMTCSACKSVGNTVTKAGKHSFISGSKNFRLSAVSDHEKSKYIRAVDILKSREDAKKKSTTAHKCVLSLNQSIRKHIEIKFRNIHALIKKNRPISDFVWLNELDEAKGIVHGVTYNNQNAATGFLECISDSEKDHLSTLMEKVKFFSITMDGSTDDSTTEQETLFVRFSMMGKITTRFLCIGEPRSQYSALDLLNFVQRKMDENCLQMQMHKLVGFGSDGASNMMGRKNGLISLIQREHSEVIGVHCLAHRMELAFKDVFRNDKNYVQLSTLLLGLFYFYKNSAKQKKNLRECMRVLDVKGTMPHRVGGSRWLPHLKKALETLFRTYPAFISHLDTTSHQNAKAGGIAKLLHSLPIIVYASILKEFINPLARLSLILQKRDITLADAKDAILSTKEVLTQFDASSSQPIRELVETKMYHGYDLKGSVFDVQKKGSEMMKAIVKHIDLRYKDLNDEVLASTVIGSLKNWPVDNQPGYFLLS